MTTPAEASERLRRAAGSGELAAAISGCRSCVSQVAAFVERIA